MIGAYDKVDDACNDVDTWYKVGAGYRFTKFADCNLLKLIMNLLMVVVSVFVIGFISDVDCCKSVAAWCTVLMFAVK